VGTYQLLLICFVFIEVHLEVLIWPLDFYRFSFLLYCLLVYIDIYPV